LRTDRKQDTKADVHFLTGVLLSEKEQQQVYNLIVDDIPCEWEGSKLLQEFNKWGKVMELSARKQKKYQTVRVKISLNDAYTNFYRAGDWTTLLGSINVRWFSARWSLSERKERERYQAAL